MARSKPVAAIEFGILALSNPFEWPNNAEIGNVDWFLTTKDTYLWPVMIHNFCRSAAKKAEQEFARHGSEEADIIADFSDRIDSYFSMMSDITRTRDARDLITLDDQRDYRAWALRRSEYLASRFGNIGQVKKALGPHLRNESVAKIKARRNELVAGMEMDGLISDPFIEPTSAGIILALGLVPHSFTKRTKEGDEHYRKIKAILWEYEETRTPTSQEYRFHFLMDKAIGELKRITASWGKESNPNNGERG